MTPQHNARKPISRKSISFKPRPIAIIITVAMVMFLITELVSGLNFIQSPVINDNLPVFTTDNIICSWNHSVDTTIQNITIYKDGLLFYNEYQTSNLTKSVTISSSNTAKNQEWTCEVTIYNSTSSITEEANVTIQNSAPETPTVSNSTGSIGTDAYVNEDQGYNYTINSSDADNDQLTYYFKSATQGFCEMTAVPNIAQCTPTQEYLNNNSQTPYNITFWVDDDDPIKAKSASLKVTFHITPVNDAPIATIEDQETPVNQTLTYNITATDEEENYPLNFSFAIVPSEISPKLTISSVDNTTATITYDAVPPDYNDVNESGWIVTINITDNQGASTLYDWILNITNSGRSPYFINITPEGPYNISQNEFLQINITAGDYDVGDSISVYTNDTRVNAEVIQNLSGSQNATIQINFTPDDSGVGNYDVMLYLEDIQGLINTTVLTFNVTNINDPPIIYEMSYNSNNTAGNNMTNLTGYQNANFIYYVNGTDYDLDSGDNITYTDNTTLFDINPSTGKIDWTPSNFGSESVNITLTDSQGAQDSRIMNFYILNNSKPYFTSDLPEMNCYEKDNCTLDLSAYATDDDVGDYIEIYGYEFIGSQFSSFSINQTTGLINFTPPQSDIGNYTLNITITDTRGASDWKLLNITINNKEDAPVFTRWDFSQSTIVESHPFTYQIEAEDDDILIGGTLNFSTNTTFLNLTFQQYIDNTGYALIQFTPTTSEVGSWSVLLNVSDNTNLSEEKIVNITVLPDSDPPVIQQIRPYGNSSSNYEYIDGWISTTDPQFNGATTASITIDENSSYNFSHITHDDLTPDSELRYYWIYDGELNGTDHDLMMNLGFHDEGHHDLQLVVEDTYLENSTWNWSITVNNVNQPPVLVEDLDTPLLINSTRTISNYFTLTNTKTHFIDPDDETVNENLAWDAGENNTLTFTATSCDAASISISGSDLTISPLQNGSCTVIFTANDAYGASVQSNIVYINVSMESQGETETQAQNNPSSGGGSSHSRTSYIPLTKEEKVPDPISIITPEVATIYSNNTAKVPVKIKNNWENEISYIKLTANTNATGITTEFTTDLIESLKPNETAETDLIVHNYRLGENFDVVVTATVDDPPFEDSAKVMFATIEHSSPGRTKNEDINVKVTFAQDLFNENPECGELNELLNKAREYLARGDVDKARVQVDSAINGCKYLVSRLEQKTEKPGLIPRSITISDLTLKTAMYSSLAIITALTIIFVIYYHYTSKEDDDI